MAEPVARVVAAAADGSMNTAVVQPLLAEISIASLTLLDRVGIRPELVLGHSFGELSALHAAGVFDDTVFRHLAVRRGRLMQDLVIPSAMLAIEADGDRAHALASKHGVDVACHNGARRYVLAGHAEAIAALESECRHAAVPTARLPADRAFHSRLMQEAKRQFAAEVAAVSTLSFGKPKLRVVSTITGGVLDDEPVPELLAEQFTSPVRFVQALGTLDQIGPVDLLIEVGASSGLGSLVAAMHGPHCMPVSMFGGSVEPLLAAIGATWVCGGNVDVGVLNQGRLIRPYRLDETPHFLVSPCGTNAVTAAPQRQAVRAFMPPSAAQPIANSRGRSAFELLQSVICELAGLPRTSVSADSRLLADLHLNSIRARHALAAAARQLGIASLPFNPAEIANARVGDMARQLEQLRDGQAGRASSIDDVPAGIEPWVRVLTHRWAPAQGDDANVQAPRPCRMRLDDSLAPLSAELRQAAAALFDSDGHGDASLPTLLILPAMRNNAVLARLLAVTKAVVASDASAGLLVLQGAQLSNAFVRSVAAERSDQRFCVLEYETLDLDALSRAVSEFGKRRRGYSELRLRGAGVEVRQMDCYPLARQQDRWLPGPADVVLVTGGAKGIGAATARFLGQTCHCRLALIGRSAAQDTEVVATMANLMASGMQATYVQADLTDPVATARAIADIESAGGAVTAIVHAAGINRPSNVMQLEFAQVEATLAAKLASLANVLQALRPGQLRLLVGFASIIGEIGLRGESHYALANEWLVEFMRTYAKASPATRCVPICWSAWRETGMAARLEGVLDELARADTRALDTAEAIGMLREILDSGQPVQRAQGDALCRPPPGGVNETWDGPALACEPLIVSGRYGRVPDALTELPVLHRHRFLEWPRVFYPGIELVADAELSTDSDPYLLDHAPYGLPVFPLVGAIEAMVSAAQCVHGRTVPPVIEDLRIGEAISLSPGQRLALRTSALALPDGSIRTSIRCSATDHAADHFSARIRLNLHRSRQSASQPRREPAEDCIPAERVLYRALVFHGPRFRRLKQYHRIGARDCLARTMASSDQRWYGRLLPQRLVGGEPALRDSVLHALQACIPQHPVLPIGAARIELGAMQADTEYLISARQTSGDGREFSFDVDVFNEGGEPVERWTGLRVARVMSDRDDPGLRRDIDPALLEAFVGRLLLDTLGERDWQVGVCGHGRGAASSQRAIGRALGPQLQLEHRADGAPLVAGHRVSISHCGELTLAVTHRLKNIGCDVQTLPIDAATDWRLMLGEQRWVFARQLAGNPGLPQDLAGLVTWSAAECLVKLGRRDWPFEAAAARRIDAPHTGPIVELRCHDIRAAIGLVRLAGQGTGQGQGVDTAIAVAVATASAPAGDAGARPAIHLPIGAALAESLAIHEASR